ncbi:hypothetical protein HMPREF1624_05432 [Sporothrix schenckii ATCC 58251]|uniref:Increased recombination centers protein 6 n=1 Tax=Sporothrix schenckii (strain ATCC 58251 / de Perez 2211183) TaxID=1391915 RepID=U7PVZ6_SPOS1|nr:hypothetical protein HMPREF1624_05432 [Sporothrix schenckii ATCC 58251]
MAPTEISNPRRILAVALAESQEHLARVIKDLTGEYPAASAGTGALAGTTQELAIQTAYYNAQVPIWLDLIGQTPAEAEAEAEDAKDNPKEEEEDKPDETNDAVKEPEDGPTTTDKNASKDDTSEDPSTPEQWADAFLADEAREVREALGGVVVVVDVQQPSAFARQRDLVKHVARLVQRLGPVVDVGLQEEDEDQEEMLADFEGVGIVVGVSQKPIDEETMEVWDDACLVAGLEFVAVAPGQEATNEFGEKTGIPRLLEALEANDWELVGDGEGDENDLFGSFQDVRLPGTASDDEINFDDPESVDFGFDRDDFAGLRQAIWQQQTAELDDDDEEDKDQAAIMESMIQRLQAARLQSELLTPAQRRAMAARVVGDVMREI